MAFISGPRQVGKTTLSRSFEADFQHSVYRNWDETAFRKTWTKFPNKLAQEFSFGTDQSNLLILDEIHKAKGWKQKLKGLYGVSGEHIQIIATGSSRLNIFKKGGDSMMGRHLNFRLHPLSYGELENPSSRKDPEHWRQEICSPGSLSLNQNTLEELMICGGFPEPFLAQSERIANIWRQGHQEKLIREDLRDLSRLPELSQVEMLTSLLPDKVGSSLSVQSLREDLEVAHDTVNRWLKYLEELYYFFRIQPWTKSIPRSLKKEPKIYMYDWAEVEDQGARFENLIASHLRKACDYWTDTGAGRFDLFYVRNKEKQEIDFVITKKNIPWLAVESKYSETQIQSAQIQKFQHHLKCPFVQVVFQPRIWQPISKNLIVCSANRFLMDLP